MTPGLVLPHTPGRVLRVRTEPQQHYCKSMSKSEKVRLDYDIKNETIMHIQKQSHKDDLNYQVQAAEAAAMLKI